MNKKEEVIPQEPTHVDLIFCFEERVILEESINKLNYVKDLKEITSSNSANAMSKSIGQQIDNLMRNQQKLEKDFEDLIVEKTKKVDLVDQKEITELIAKIEGVAEQLKKSTNNICKSLAENPDIPSNLGKAQTDMKYILTDLLSIRDDLTNGNFKKFEAILDIFNAKSFNIEDLRKQEMDNLNALKIINEQYSKEDQDYIKDQKNLNAKLVQAKKELAKTKMESSILKDYRKAELEALQKLKISNFNDDEERKKLEIEEKQKEKDTEILISGFIQQHLKDQTQRLQGEKAAWEKKKTDMDNMANNKKSDVKDRITKKENQITDYQEQNNKYRADIDKLSVVPKNRPDTAKSTVMATGGNADGGDGQQQGANSNVNTNPNNAQP